MPEPKYRVGIANDPRPEDKWYTLADAIERANKLAATDNNLPVAVWNEHCEIVKLFFAGEEFKPV